MSFVLFFTRRCHPPDVKAVKFAFPGSGIEEVVCLQVKRLLFLSMSVYNNTEQFRALEQTRQA